MWAVRFERLTSAIDAGDLEGALDAALSLSASSHMVGAHRLEQYAVDLVAALHQGRLASAQHALPAPGRCGGQTVDELVATHLGPRAIP